MYIPLNKKNIQNMLETIGVKSIDELFADIPANLGYKSNGSEFAAISALEIEKKISDADFQPSICFAGAGIYDHYIPAAVDAIASRSEFYTAYTPYQPEISQGALQYIFEYQTMVCALTGLEVSNASLYDCATALVEAIKMAVLKKNKKLEAVVFLTESLNANYRAVVNTYLKFSDIRFVTIPCDNKTGQIDCRWLDKHISEADAICIQSPNYYGVIEDLDAIASICAKNRDIVKILVCYPFSLGILKKPGEVGFDIAVGEGQCLGLPMSAGGPLLGMIAARNDFLRFIPGRIVGKTVDKDGKTGFTLTLQTREQHIKRERALSNICSNESLCALRSIVYMSLIGGDGLEYACELIQNNTRYLITECLKRGLKLKFDAPVFNEFLLQFPDRFYRDNFILKAERANITPGVTIFGEQFDDCLLVAVTEKLGKSELDKFINLI